MLTRKTGCRTGDLIKSPLVMQAWRWSDQQPVRDMYLVHLLSGTLSSYKQKGFMLHWGRKCPLKTNHRHKAELAAMVKRGRNTKKFHLQRPRHTGLAWNWGWDRKTRELLVPTLRVSYRSLLMRDECMDTDLLLSMDVQRWMKEKERAYHSEKNPSGTPDHIISTEQ